MVPSTGIPLTDFLAEVLHERTVHRCHYCDRARASKLLSQEPQTNQQLLRWHREIGDRLRHQGAKLDKSNVGKRSEPFEVQQVRPNRRCATEFL